MDLNKNISNKDKPNSMTDILITIFIVVVSVGIKYADLGFRYRQGLASRMNLMLVVICGFVYVSLIFALLILMTIRVCEQGRLIGSRGVIIRILLIGLSLSTVIVIWKFTKSGQIYFRQGFEEKVRNEADILAIRKWLKNIDQNIFDKYTAEELQKWRRKISIEESDWPTSITSLSPQYVYIGISKDDKYSVCLVWGGPFGHWGIIVGPETMDIYETELTFWGDIWVKVEPGVYVWYDD